MAHRRPTRHLRPRKRCHVLITFALFLAVTIHTVRAYDFTNLGAAEFKRLRRANQASAALNATIAPPPEPQAPELPDDEADRHISSTQTPIHWFFQKLYGIDAASATINTTKTNANASFTNSSGSAHKATADTTAPHANTTYAFIRIPANASVNANGSDTSAWQPMTHERIEDEAVKYNVSFLGLKDPFARHATKLSYDYRIDVGEPSKNGRGSIVSLLNGTIYPLGSVGAMSAVGWSGGTNETRTNSAARSANGTAATNSTAPSTSALASATNGTSNTTAAPPAGTSVAPHNDGMTGIWLAFTSQHAVTGGYTMHSKHVSVTNNVLFHNVTFRSNFTIDAHGRFSFVFTMGTVDESDQMSDDDGDGILTKSKSNTTAPAANSTTMSSPPTITNANSTAHAKPTSPIRLDGPHCTPMKGTQYTEAAFRMRCEGAKMDTTTTS